MEIEKIVPKDGPSIDEVKKYIDKYKNELIVIKYGGNVFIDRNIFNNFISDINILNKLWLSIIIVHGGGPRIKRELEKSNIQSKFIRGLRVTDEKIINIVEKVLIDFNDDIVNSLKKKGTEAISINTKNNYIYIIYIYNIPGMHTQIYILYTYIPHSFFFIYESWAQQHIQM